MATPTDRAMFKRLALVRLKEAKRLYRARCFDGAYYLAGICIECALKAAICKQFKRFELPNVKFVKDVYDGGHNLPLLLAKADLVAQLAEEEDGRVRTNWGEISQWSIDARYRLNTEEKARDILKAIDGDDSPFLKWVQERW